MAKQVKDVTLYKISPAWSMSPFTSDIGLLNNFEFHHGDNCNQNNSVNKRDCSAIGKKICSEVIDGCYVTSVDEDFNCKNVLVQKLTHFLEFY